MRVITEKKKSRSLTAKETKEKEQEAQRRLDTEVLHQAEESERRALCQAMISEAEKNPSALNSACLNVLNNFQGNIIKVIKHLLSELIIYAAPSKIF